MATAPITKKIKKAKGPASGATAAGQVQSLSRGLTLLEYISESTGGIALTDLALQAGLTNSTTHRLLMTLEQHGFVRQTGDLGLWVIASHAFIIGSSFLESRNLLALVHPILRRLMDESGETVNLAILDHTEYDAVIVDQVQCNALMRMSAPIGGKLPLHASGAGKAFIANLPEDKLVPLLSRKGLHAYTPYTLTNPSALKENLQQAKKQGFSYDDEEHALGLRCIGACIYDEHKDAFAAISISGPLSRITDDRITELGAMVIKAAKEISREYGANR